MTASMVAPIYVGLSQCNKVAVLKMCQPSNRNAFSSSFIAKLDEALRWLNQASKIHTTILCSDVPGVFSSGADLQERLEMSTHEVRDFVTSLRAITTNIEDLPMPTIACIDGTVLGGGMEFALGCDLRVATAHSILGFPEVSLATIPGAGGTQRLPRLIRPSLAKLLIYTSSKIDSSTAADMGFIDFVVGKNHQLALPHLLQKKVEHEGLDEQLETLRLVKEEKFGTTQFREIDVTVIKPEDVPEYSERESITFTLPVSPSIDLALLIASQMTSWSPLALRAAKRAIVRGLWTEQREAAMDIERCEYDTIVNTHDRVEALKAFVEKRPPQFKGE